MSALKKVRDEVSAVVRSIRADRKNLNQLLELEANLNMVTGAEAVKKTANADKSEERPSMAPLVQPLLTKEDEARAVASLRGAVQLFEHFISIGDVDKTENSQNKEGREGAKDQREVHMWLGQRLNALWNHLCHLISENRSQSLAELATVGAFKLLRAAHLRAKDLNPSLDHWSEPEVKRLRSLVAALCSTRHCRAERIRR